jgi:hypothetical protein
MQLGIGRQRNYQTPVSRALRLSLGATWILPVLFLPCAARAQNLSRGVDPRDVPSIKMLVESLHRAIAGNNPGALVQMFAPEFAYQPFRQEPEKAATTERRIHYAKYIIDWDGDQCSIGDTVTAVNKWEHNSLWVMTSDSHRIRSGTPENENAEATHCMFFIATKTDHGWRVSLVGDI